MMTVQTHESRHARRGFTLAELVIVMVIMATLAAVTVPRFASAGASYRSRGAAEQVASAIREAAVTARSRSTSVRVRMHEPTNNFNALVVADAEYISLFDIDERPFNADLTGIRYGTGTELTIDGFGSFSTCAIYRIAAGDQERAVVIDAGAGTVSVVSAQEATEFRDSERFK